MSPSPASIDVVVVGAGIAGLAAAYRAKKAGRSVVLIEKSNRAGGVVRSELQDGYLLEFGPNTVLMTAELLTLVEALGLSAELLTADARTPRYINFQQKLHPVPMSPLKLMASSLLSVSGKLRLLREPWIAPGNIQEETLADFAERRLGPEAADRLVAPFVSGVWAGDSQALSAGATFPSLLAWEKKYRSIFKGMKAEKKPGERRGLFSFQKGLETLPAALAKELAGEIRFGSAPSELSRSASGKWKVAGNNFEAEAAEVVITTPAWETARMVRPLAPEASATLNNIRYAPVAVLHLGFNRSAVSHPLDGFGYLNVPSEKPDILGCVWSSSLFTGRAPVGHVLLTVFMGGATQPGMVGRTEAELISRAVDALRHPLGITGEPVFKRITRYERAIPQYNLGHQGRVDLLQETEQKNPGIFLRGNYRGGISVGDVIRRASS